jgi:hypothetical protein
MGKKIHHMGMSMTREEHDRFHKSGEPLSPKQHDSLMKRLGGVTKEQHDEWHRTHLTPEEQRAQTPNGMKRVNTLAVGRAFLTWCVQQGWLVPQGKQYLATAEGARELRERFGIEL